MLKKFKIKNCILVTVQQHSYVVTQSKPANYSWGGIRYLKKIKKNVLIFATSSMLLYCWFKKLNLIKVTTKIK